MSPASSTLFPSRMSWAAGALLLWLAGLLMVAGQTHRPLDYSIRRWEPSHEMPLSSVDAITQTRDGFLWFAMNSGLGRFDGITMEVFGAHNTEAFSVSYATSLTEGRDGRLWIGTAGGGLFRFWQGQFDRFGTNAGLANEQVKALSFGPDGRLWIGTDGGGVFVRPADGGQIHPMSSGLPEPHINTILHDAQGRPVVLTRRNGPFRWTGEHFEPIEIIPPAPKFPLKGLTRGYNGRLWLGGTPGIYQYDGNAFREWTPARAMSKEVPLVAWEVATNEVWLGTDQNLIHWKSGAWAVYPTGGAVLESTIGGFAVDQEGSIWVSTEGRGLVQMKRTPAVTIGTGEGLPGDEVTSVITARDGSVWVATSTGLARIDAAGIRRFSDQDGLPESFYFSLQEDDSGTIWAASRRGRLVRWTGERFVTEPTGAQRIWCLAKGAEGTLWAGTPRGAVQYRDGKQVRVVNGSQGLSNEDVRCIMDDRRGTIWIGTSYGLNQVDASGIRSYTKVEGVDDPIEVVISMTAERDGGLWIGTLNRGLFLMRGARFININAAMGLPSNTIASLVEDDHGNLWFGTARGLARLLRSDIDELLAGRAQAVMPLVIDRNKGLRTEEFTASIQPTAARDPGGRLWFASSDGLATIDPSNLFQNDKTPMTSLIRLGMEGPERVSRLDATASDAGGSRDLLAMALEDNAPAPAGARRSVFTPLGVSEVRIPAAMERLDFQFVAPSFMAPNAVTYRYTLEGFDSGWVEAGARRSAYYTRVPPGRFRFRVQARNEDGFREDPGAELWVAIAPSWWQTGAFHTAFAAVILLFSYGFYRVICIQVRRRSDAAARLSRQLLRSQEQERARLAGELHDGLGQELQLIRNRAELALRRASPPPELARELTSISETASRAIGGVRALSRGLRPPELDQLGLTQALRWLGQNIAETFAGRFEYQIDPIDKLLPAQCEVDLYRVAQEALNNAVKHSGASDITFEVVRTGNGLQLSVFDNGQGFAMDEVEGQQRGYGLRTLRERAAMLQGQLQLRSERSVGTRLTLQVPIPDNPVHAP